MLQKLRGHHRTHCVRTQIIRARRAAAISIKTGQRVLAALHERFAQHISIRHTMRVGLNIQKLHRIPHRSHMSDLMGAPQTHAAERGEDGKEPLRLPELLFEEGEGVR